MRKTILTAILSLLSFVTFAKHIDENKAKIVGQAFLNNQVISSTLRSSSELELVYKSGKELTTRSDSSHPRTFFYVYNLGTTGFVIVSGDDNVTPILAYSDESAFNPNNIPYNAKKWLEEYKKEINYVIENNIASTAEIQQQWENYLNGSSQNNRTFKFRSGSVSPLIQTKWDQSPYENALCPYDNNYNEKTVTGCPATAMAQIMKYWNYPTTGSGFHSYNHQTYGTLSANFGSTTYQWSSMPNIINSSNNAVATLMYHCGVAVEMNYGVAATGGSGSYVIAAYSPSVEQTCENAFKTYFGYDASTIQGLKRSNYSDNNWISLLKNELDQGRPIQYAGFGSGGHTWVCDGYDNNDFFHMNWGWGGSQDGYFQINSLNPGAGGIGGAGYSYNNNQQALIGIQPPSGGTPQNYSLQLYSNITMPSTQIWFTNAFSLTVDIANLGTSSFSGQYGAAIFDHNYNFVDFMEIQSNMSLNSNSHYTNGLTFNNAGSTAFVPGTYYVAMFYKTTTQNWTIIGDGSYTNLEQFEIIYSADIETNSTFTITTNGGKLIQGNSATVNVDVLNTGSSTFYGQYRVSLSNLDGSFAQSIQVVNENNGLPINYYYSGGNNFTGIITVEPGTYLMEVAYKAQGSSSWYYAGSSNYSNPVYVIVEAPGLSPDQYENNDIANNAYTLPISFSGNTTTKNTIGSNFHIGTDYDFYKLTLPADYNYTISARLHDSYNSGDGNTYSADGLFAYSTDNGNTWSDFYDDVMASNITIQNGGTVYFHVAPYFSGETGTYLLDMTINRNQTILSIGKEKENENDVVNIYPNPAKDFVNIDLKELKDVATSILILNIQGQQIYSSNILSSEQIINLPLQNVSTGIYFVQIHTLNGIVTQKIIIE